MRFQKQLNRHKPEEGIYGDCDRTVVACFLDLSPEDVPNWSAHDDWSERKKRWLYVRDIQIIRCDFEGENTLNSVLHCVGAWNPDQFYALTGCSKNRCGHIVICQNDKIVWDTSIDNSGIVDPHPDTGMWHIEFITRRL